VKKHKTDKPIRLKVQKKRPLCNR